MPKPTAKSNQTKLPQPMSFMMPLLAPQIEQFWDVQDKMLDESQRFMLHWFARRHEAVRSGLETGRAATTESFSNPMTAMSLMASWQKQSADRLAKDTKEWFETLSRCADYAVRTESKTLEQTVSEAKDLTRKITKSSKSEPV